MKKFSYKIRGHKYEVEVLNQEGKVLDIEVNGSKYSVELDREIQVKKTPTLVREAVLTHKEIEKKETTGNYVVKCPLPGNIMSINVKVGDKVNVGDDLLMYEAMKMENIIKAEKAGTVSKILVTPGEAVLQEAILMQID
jgi:biotin carboxyl carrier protein